MDRKFEPDLDGLRRHIFWQRVFYFVVITVLGFGGLMGVISPQELKELIQRNPVPTVSITLVYCTIGFLIALWAPARLEYPIRIRIVTSSDWTTLRLVDDVTWGFFEPLFASQSAEVAEFDGQVLHLTQPITDAQNGQVVEMVVKMSLFRPEMFIDVHVVTDYFKQWFETPKIDFEIERGHLGWTHVEMSNHLAEEPVVVENFWWCDIAPGERNVKSVNLPASALFGPQSAYNPPEIDATTLQNKVLCGYQGWFGCPEDGSDLNQWFHWFRNNTPTAENLTIDFWPDMSELDPEERFTTELSLPNGDPAELFSSYTQKTVVRHFAWMADHEIEGVFLQRFASELDSPQHFCFRNKVAQNVRIGSEKHGRLFAIMYDMTGALYPLEKIQRDWTFLAGVLKITESPNYLRHKGRPVVGVWGPGFNHVYVTPLWAREIIYWLHEGIPNPAHATIVGGVPTHWRTLQGDSRIEPEWADIYRSYDVLCPWSVSRYNDDSSADSFANNVVAPDMSAAAAANVDYMPVVFPGFSWHNLNPGSALNQVPRNGGKFFWRQAQNVIKKGAQMIYVAMFDEVDEGTAMFKVVAKNADLPIGADLVALDRDGYQLSNNWYLKVTGMTGEMLRGEIPTSAELSP